MEKIRAEEMYQMSHFNYWMSHCTNEENWGEKGCPEKDPDSIDLAVLTIKMCGFKKAMFDEQTGQKLNN